MTKTLRPAMPARPWTHAALAMLAAAALTLGTFACGGSPTGASANVTDPPYTGTVAKGGTPAFFGPFTVAKDGTVTMTVTSLSPDAGVGVYLGLGPISGSSCVIETSQTLYAGQPLTFGAIPAGQYCGEIADIGFFTQDNTFSVTVSHP